MLGASQYQDPKLKLVGVVVEGPKPLGLTAISLEEGMTVLYGRNGAGKSRLLSAVRACLEGVRQPYARSWLVAYCSDVNANLDLDEGLDPALWMFFEHVANEARSLDPFNTEPTTTRLAEALRPILSERFSCLHDRPAIIEELLGEGRILMEANGTADQPAWTLWLGAVEEEANRWRPVRGVNRRRA